jgi:hypothetical protein
MTNVRIKTKNIQKKMHHQEKRGDLLIFVC